MAGYQGTKAMVMSSEIYHDVSYFSKKKSPWRDLRINQSKLLILHPKKLRSREVEYFLETTQFVAIFLKAEGRFQS